MNPFFRRDSTLITVEGIWGVGKSTVTNRLYSHLHSLGFQVELIHYGDRKDIGERLLRELDVEDPVRMRVGEGGFEEPYHGYVEVLLRFAREFYDQYHFFKPALERNEIVILDRGIDSIFAYCMATLHHCYPDLTYSQIYGWLKKAIFNWSLIPDLTLYLNLPWNIAYERAVQRGGGKVPALEKKIFMPQFASAYEYLATVEHRIEMINYSEKESAEDVTEMAIQRLNQFLSIK